MENQTNLVSHPYYIILDLIKEEIHTKRWKKKTRIVNSYNNTLGEKYTW